MIKSTASKKGSIHLYNPKHEGLGAYDVHYINAYKKEKKERCKHNQIKNERNAA